MKTIVLVLIVGLIALTSVLPVSAAGQGGNGMMQQSGSGAGTGVCLNPDCPQQDCQYDQIQSRDGTGKKSGQTGSGHGPDGRGSGCRFKT